MHKLVRRKRAQQARAGVATLEVVMVTGVMIPSLFFLLYLGFRAMAAFISVLGTMIGSPLV